jgi:hypothetical protein
MDTHIETSEKKKHFYREIVREKIVHVIAARNEAPKGTDAYADKETSNGVLYKNIFLSIRLSHMNSCSCNK